MKINIFHESVNLKKENLGQYILNPLLYIGGTIARDVRGDKE